jgi:hypothetical protein
MGLELPPDDITRKALEEHERSNNGNVETN